MLYLSRYILVFLIFLPLLTKAQEDFLDSVHWCKGLAWDEIKAKAKSENKYIFIDCIATWCKPCKEMDKTVYRDRKVTNVINQKLIPMKLQMNKNVNDPPEVIKWHSFAKSIDEELKIKGYPTFIFFSPSGVIVHRDIGYKSANKFVEMITLATTPGKEYINPYIQFNKKLLEYRNGSLRPDEFESIINLADQLEEWSVKDSLLCDYNKYLERLPRRELFNKRNIQFIARNLKGSKDKFFYLFYSHGKKVDKVIERKRYSMFLVDTIIHREEIEPFLQTVRGEIQKKDVKRGVEPDWKRIETKIASAYKEDYVERAIRAAKLKFYQMADNKSAYIGQFALQVQKNDLDTNAIWMNGWSNAYAWVIFLNFDDKDTINMAIKWMKDVVRRYPYTMFIDTYANLLFKAGNIKDAIVWEEEAIRLSIRAGNDNDTKSFQKTLIKIKSGEPTWPMSISRGATP